ncbi:MAG: hypothetical protein KGI70_02440 [Patescibacteria group bacterium]|nr:hypothetical protein [Patescibacteria group bacterium]
MEPGMEPTQRHIWQHLLNPKVAIVVIGCIAVVVGAWTLVGHKAKGGALSPSSGPEGTVVSIKVPKGTSVPAGAQLVLTDAGEHGYVAKQQGGGMFVAYDPTKGLTYKIPATLEANGDNYSSYSAEVPQGVCGLIIKSVQEPNPQPKVLSATLVGPDEVPVPGVSGSFSVTCDTFTLKIVTTASQDPVLPDGVDQSTVTATLTVKGPAQFINGQRIKAGGQKPVIETPLGLTPVEFTTDLGTLNPASPAKVTTDLSGRASVTITSADAGIASVRAIAPGIGDAKQQIHFKPVIVAVNMVFVQPQSPTTYQLKTIPANPKDLDFAWSIAFPAGACGSLTGGASSKGLVKNAYYHGPQDGAPNGCDEKLEMAARVTVTATDKDGQSDTKTFGARSSEGQGWVNLK